MLTITTFLNNILVNAIDAVANQKTLFWGRTDSWSPTLVCSIHLKYVEYSKLVFHWGFQSELFWDQMVDECATDVASDAVDSIFPFLSSFLLKTAHSVSLFSSVFFNVLSYPGLCSCEPLVPMPLCLCVLKRGRVCVSVVCLWQNHSA